MAINTQKFLPSSKGSAIVKASKKTIKASSFVSNEKTEDVSGSIQKISKDYSLGFLSEKLLNDISFVRVKVIEIDKLLKGTLANEKKEIAKRKREEEKKRFEKTETKLEAKPNIESGKLPIPSLPRMGILDWIKNFIKNVVIGYFAIRLIKYLPKIMPIVKTIASVADFTIDFAGKLLDGLVTFIDWAYKAHDATKGFLKNIGGENFVKLFDKFNSAIGTLIETAIIAAIIASTQRSDSFVDTPTKGGRKTAVKVTQGRGGSRTLLRLPGTGPTVTKGKGRLPGTGLGTPRLPGTGPTVTQGRGRLPGTRPGIPRLPGTGPTVTQGRGGSGIFSRINKFFSGVGSKITSKIPKAGPFAKLTLAMGKVGKIAGKAIPFAGAVIGIAEGINRLSKGDMIGAGLSFGSAIPVLGWGFLAADIIRSAVGPKTFDEFYLNNILPFLIPGVGGFVKQFLDKTGVTKKIIRQNQKNKQSQSIGFGEILKGFGGGYVKPKPKPKPKPVVKVIKSAEGGKVKSQVTRGGKIFGGVRRSIKATRKGKYKRKLSPKKPQEVKITSPGINVGGEKKIFGLFPNPLKMVKNAAQKVSEVVNPFNVIKKSGETLGKSDYFGPILSITSKILLGQKPEQQDYKNVGLGINLLVSKGIDEGKLKGGLMAAFADGGFVDPKSLDAITEGGDISDWVAKSFKDATETNAQKTLREIQENLKLKKEEKPEEPSSAEDTGGEDGMSEGGITGTGVNKGISVAKKLIADLGVTPAQAAGIVGNFLYESAGMNPGEREGAPYGTPEKPPALGTVGVGYGWAQWTNSAPGDRLDKFLKSYGGDRGKIATDNDNYRFLMTELRGNESLTSKGIVTGTYFPKEDPLAASDWFRRNWERAGVPADEKRRKETLAVFNKIRALSREQAKMEVERSGGRISSGESEGADSAPTGGGVVGGKLRTGPSAFIGGSTEYHIDTKFHKSLGMGNMVSAVDRLSRAYSSRGRKIEFSNPGVSGQVWNPNASGNEKRSLLQRAFDAHSHSRFMRSEGFLPFDYYNPKKNETRFGRSVVGSEILLPSFGGKVNVGKKYGGYGKSADIYNSSGKWVAMTGHGDVRYEKGGFTKPYSHKAEVGEKGREFVIDADSTAAIESSVPGLLNAINKAKYIDATRVIKNYAVKEIMSDNGFMSALNKSKYEEVSNIVSSYADRELNPKTEFLSKSSSGKYKDSITPLSSYAEYESGSEQIVTIPQVMINNIISDYEEQSPTIMSGFGGESDDPFESMYMMS